MDDRPDRKSQHNYYGNLNNLMCRSAKRAVVIYLACRMGMRNLNESAHQNQRNAHDSQ